MLPELCVDCDDLVPCCHLLYDACRGILEAAWTAFAACAPPDCCEPVQRFVAATEPHLAMQDYLAVWVESLVLPTKTTNPQGKDFLVQQPVGSFGIKLVESGYPTIVQVGTTIEEPSADDLDFIAKHSLAHAEALYTGVLKYLIASNTCGWLKGNSGLRSVVSGGVLGWSFSVDLELSWR